MPNPRVYHLGPVGEPLGTDEQVAWRTRCIADDERFKEAMLTAHPDLVAHVNEAPGTECPRMLPR